jgi:hypothetical protein
MSHQTTTVHVEASPEVIFDLVADPARGPEWQTLVTDMGGIAGRPGGIGSSYVGYYRLAGRRVEGRFVVTAAERPKLLHVAGTTRGGWAHWTTLIESTGEGSLVRASLEYELPGDILGSVLGLLAGNRIDQELRRTYANLKRVAERDARGGAPLNTGRAGLETIGAPHGD